MIKLNMWIKKHSLSLLWAAGILTAAGIVLSRCDFPTAGNICFLLAFALSGLPVMLSAAQALRFKTVSIELLVTIAAVGACFIGEFNEAAIVTFLFRFGSFLEQKTMKKTRSAIRELTDMAPTTAWRIIGSGDEGEFETEEIDADEVEIGDLLLVKAGGQIAADGVVVKGEGYAAQAGITGEPLPVHKAAGDGLYAGTILDSGTLQMRSTKVGEDTTFARIIALVEEAQDAKSPVERFIDKFAKYYTPAVIVIAALVLIFTGRVDTAITVLVLACPGALVIGAPIANVAGIGRGAQEGILLKGGDSVHTFSKTHTFVFDKTGTLTEGVPMVCLEKCYTSDRDEALSLAASAERAAEHPLARCVVKYAEGLPAFEAEDVQIFKGCGVAARIKGHHVLAGNLKLMEQQGVKLSQEQRQDMNDAQKSGATTVLIAVDGELRMLLGISDRIKPEAKDSLDSLRRLGINQLVMLTGDNEGTAAAVAEKLGIGSFRAELLPEDKLKVIRGLQGEGEVVTFVGDGINDSPALAAADTGIAMGSGTDAAIDNSAIVLIKSDLDSMVRALYLARKTVRVMYENIAIAVGTVVLLLIGLFAGYIHMSLGMLIHEASILVVILNAMRLLIPNKKRREHNEKDYSA